MRHSDVLDDLANAAARCQEMTRDHEEYLRRIVGILRKAGATWEDVGKAMGTSKQAAWERFR